MVYRLLGKARKALSYLECCLKNTLKEYDENHPKLANLWRELGEVFDDLGQSQKAVEFFQKGLFIEQKEGGNPKNIIEIKSCKIG